MVDEAEVSRRLALVAGVLMTKMGDLSTAIVAAISEEVPRLVYDEESMLSLLLSSSQQTISTALQVFQHDLDPSEVTAPASAVEHARRLAQRGTPAIDLIRAYHLGQAAVLDFAMAEGFRMGGARADSPALTSAMARKTLAVTYAYVDRITQQVVTAYHEERDRWLLNRSAVRAARVRGVLDDGGVDVAASEAALGYRLRGTHVGMVVWHDGGSPGGNQLTALETLTDAIAAAGARVLFVPQDEVNAWVWLAVEEPVTSWRAHVEAVLADREPGLRVALGEPASGVDGFRRTHRQALRVQALSQAVGEHGDTVMTFGDVGSIALMATDLDATRAWVTDTLGPMAVDDEQQRRLRETLRVFLATGSSYTAAASQLTMHKNSVQYRVRKAEELLGKQVAENRLDLELALNLCHWLGPAVLSPP